MDENILRLRVGIFVVIAMLILGILIFLHSDGLQRQYTIYIKTVSAPGVTVNTPIRKNGILIGRVNAVETQDDGVLLGLAINEKEEIFSNEQFSIGSASFFGDAVVEVLPKPVAERGERVTADYRTENVTVKRNPMEFVDLAMNLRGEISETLQAVQKAGDAVDQAGSGITELTETIQTAFEDDNSEFKKMIAEFRTTNTRAQLAFDNFSKLFENLNEVAGNTEVKDQFMKAVYEVPRIFEELRATIGDTRKRINEFRSITEKANKNLDQLDAFTGSLQENGPEILVQVRKSLTNVDNLVAEITKFTESISKIQNSEGTLGKLINDPAVYDSVLETVDNVRDISTRLEPLVNDLRMFADALARDPGVIGVRGAFDRRPQKTGYKGTAGRENGSINR